MWQPPPGFPFHNTGGVPAGAAAAALAGAASAGPWGAAAAAGSGGAVALAGPGGTVAASGGTVAWAGSGAAAPFMHMAAHSGGQQQQCTLQMPSWMQQVQQPVQHIPFPMPAAGGPRRRALICGINYLGMRGQLKGCINDAKCVEYLLKKPELGFKQEDIVVMTDDLADPRRRPTKANIMQGVRWLVGDLKPGDSLVFHFSGHGGTEADPTGLEHDGENQTLCPLDYQKEGVIVDDDLNRMLISPLPQGVKLHAIIDACHSGSVLDLPHQATVRHGSTTWGYAFNRQVHDKGTSGGFAVQFSAAMDRQTAADTSMVDGAARTGAATFAFIKALERQKFKLTYEQLLLQMHYAVKETMLEMQQHWDESQDAVLSCNVKFDLQSTHFSL